MSYQFEFRPYQRPFKQPLFTNHGKWEVREGIILRLSDAKGHLSWGEIAPLPWFGSESFEEALNFCTQLSADISAETIFSISDALPACQFGFESAVNGFGQTTDHQQLAADSFSSLLPAGEAALQAWQTLWNQGYRTFKWKIGVAPICNEIKTFDQLIRALPTSAKLRLDANGGLSWEEAHKWLQVCAPFGVEFIEQPLSADQFDVMLELNNQYSTPIALDESVATLNQLQACYQLGWRGIFVIKPAIVGSPTRLRQFCQQHDIDAVFSSVFETAIGRQAALQLSAELSHRHRALGFGVNHWFEEDDQTWLERLWQKV